MVDDGEPQHFTLAVGEGRSFHATTSIGLRLSEGGSAEVTVSGDDKGFPGVPGRPWEETYRLGAASPAPAG